MLEENQSPKNPPTNRKLTPFYWLDFLIGFIGGVTSDLALFMILPRLVYDTLSLCRRPNPFADVAIYCIMVLVALLCRRLFQRKPHFAEGWLISGSITALLLLLLALIL